MIQLDGKNMREELASRERRERMLGLYLHVPFCLKKCAYCDFCSFPGEGDSTMIAYTEELCRRLIARSFDCERRGVDTLYFGGGTPTLLPLSCFERILGVIRAHYRLTDDCEITVECNPATADRDYLTALRHMGVNRLSIGLQSAHDRELRLLGRSHTVADFEAVFGDARAAGFENISADLMYGLPDQTVEDFRESLVYLASLAPEHISAYGLKIEEGTPFHHCQDKLVLPNDDEEYEMYLLCTRILGEYGYEKYEISNFARPGRESRHNLRYWQGGDYLGFGVAAHSCFGGERFGNSRDLAAFLRGENILCEQTVLSPGERDREFLMLNLRLSRGIGLEEFARRFGKPLHDYYPALTELIAAGYLQEKGGYLSFTDQGFFVSNTILSELLEAVESPD